MTLYQRLQMSKDANCRWQVLATKKGELFWECDRVIQISRMQPVGPLLWGMGKHLQTHAHMLIRSWAMLWSWKQWARIWIEKHSARSWLSFLIIADRLGSHFLAFGEFWRHSDANCIACRVWVGHDQVTVVGIEDAWDGWCTVVNDDGVQGKVPSYHCKWHTSSNMIHLPTCMWPAVCFCLEFCCVFLGMPFLKAFESSLSLAHEHFCNQMSWRWHTCLVFGCQCASSPQELKTWRQHVNYTCSTTLLLTEAVTCFGKHVA